MTTIPKDITIPLGDLQRNAIRSLLQKAPTNYQLSDLFDLILAKGLSALLVCQDLPEVRRQLAERSERSIPEGIERHSIPRVSSDYVGFPLDAEQDARLEELLKAHPHLSEEEVCRIVLDFGLRAMKTVPFAKTLLANTKPGKTPDAGGQP
jgi:hypothetical protein